MEELLQKIMAFRDARDWKQFHNPKNLATSIVIESSELLEIFQWTKTSDSYNTAEEKKDKLKEEMADILIYLLTLSHDTKIDLLQAANEKLDLNAKKYPVGKSKGNSKKYNQL